jgi:hypothetical protein
MAGDGGYETPAAVRSALTTAVKLLPEARRGAAVREFVHDRFLCRVFALKEPWVLKGGTAMLARVADARHTKDVDLWNETRDMDLALASIDRAINLDLGDHLTFSVVEVVTTLSGRQLVLEAYLGATRADRFKVDVVVGSLVTAPIEIVEPANRIPLARLGAQHPYRVYPGSSRRLPETLSRSSEDHHSRRPSNRPQRSSNRLSPATTREHGRRPTLLGTDPGLAAG